MSKTEANIQKSNKRVNSDKPSTSAGKRIKTSTTTNDNEVSASQLCTPKAITDLPEEVLQKILEFAVGKSKRKGFLNASLVCQLWNRLISNSKWMMDNLIPIIKCQRYSNIPNATKFQITRDYRELEVNADYYIYFGKKRETTVLLPHPLVILTMISISSIAQHLRKLKLTNMKITPHHISALSLLENFESLYLYHCHADEYTIEPIELDKLKSLKIHEDEKTTTDIFPWIKPCRIMNFIEVISCKNLDSSSIINFLRQIESLNGCLNKLTWDREDCFCLEVEFNSEFRWEKLEFEWFCLNHKQRLHSILKLIEAINPQAALDNAEYIIKIKEEFLRYVDSVNELVKLFNTCKNFKTLDINTYPSNRNVSSEVLNSFPVVNSVEKLILRSTYGAGGENELMNPATRFFLENLPNVKEVELKDELLCYSDVIKNLSLLKNLKYLKIYYPHNHLSDVFSELNIVKFESLQKLTILLNKLDRYFENEVPQILYNTYDATEAIWKFCAVNPTLNHLNFQLNDHPFWEITRNSNREVKEKSLIRLYTEWLEAETSVKTCRIIIQEKYIAPAKTREEKEFKIFGRILSESEREFFIDIHVF